MQSALYAKNKIERFIAICLTLIDMIKNVIHTKNTENLIFFPSKCENFVPSKRKWHCNKYLIPTYLVVDAEKISCPLNLARCFSMQNTNTYKDNLRYYRHHHYHNWLSLWGDWWTKSPIEAAFLIMTDKVDFNLMQSFFNAFRFSFNALERFI